MCGGMNDIYALNGIDADRTKDNDYKGNRTIVYGKDAKGRPVNNGYINIVGYINWLKANGGYGSLNKLSASQPKG